MRVALVFLLVWGAFAMDSAGLLTVKRVYVDKLGGGTTAEQMRDMIISSLQNAKLFAITENEERADTILRGSSEDLVYTEEHQSSDGINANAHASSGASTRYSSSKALGMSIGENENSRSHDRRHEASAAVRMVN